MKLNERNAGRRGIVDKKTITLFVSGEDNKQFMKAEAKRRQVLEPRLKGKSNGIHSIKKN